MVSRQGPAVMRTDLHTGYTDTKMLLVVYLKFRLKWVSCSFSGNPIHGVYLALGRRDWGMGSDQGGLKVLCYLKGPEVTGCHGQAVMSMRGASHGARGDLRVLAQFRHGQPPAAIRGASSFHFSREARNPNVMGNVPIFK